MAKTSMTSANALTVKLWELKGFVDMYKKSAFGHMSRRGTLMRAEELDRANAGDETTFNFTGILTGVGMTEGGTLTGNEEALDNQAFTMVFNEVRHAVLNPNKDTIQQQRTTIRFEERARELLPQWHMSRMDASVFNQLAGVDSTTITVDGTVYANADRVIVQGLNTINAPTTNRIIRANAAATDQAITSSDTFTLDLIDAAVEQLARTYPTVALLDDDMLDLYISPEQYTDLKRDTSGAIQWFDIYRAQIQGGVTGKENPIFGANHMMGATRPVGVYGNTLIYVMTRVANGENSSTNAVIPNVRRAVLCGKNAIAFASAYSGALEDMAETKGNVPLKFFSQLKDYDHDKGIEGRMIYGVKKLQFDGEDFGSTVISTFAGPHTK